MTAQIPDQLVYRGRKRSLYSNPLESYWNDQRPRPEWPATSSACWRGYVASWTIKHQKLYLTDVQFPFATYTPNVERHFQGRTLPIHADWYSGHLRLPDGEELRYVHMGYSSEYAIDLYLVVWKGQVVLEEEFDNRQKICVKRSTTAALDQLYGAEEASFMRSIYHYPADEAPRLIYADWLQEQNDQRAELLRTYIANRDSRPWDDLPGELLWDDHRRGWLWWRMIEFRP